MELMFASEIKKNKEFYFEKFQYTDSYRTTKIVATNNESAMEGQLCGLLLLNIIQYFIRVLNRDDKLFVFQY